ncbi:uncharacterized protein LOC119183246 isoform X2 [Rhipicephalus microplus]|uniref:uncharacterized protein LOC119183246 isoform X2 n=1 Tax=Rhipicephalus microplus TaxID=6941 RepID=UPI003F6AFAFD
MGYVFCLVIFQSGNRRKLKLATGAYSELVEKLTEIVDVDHKNTLVQMFDTDLDDFVDLVPGEKIPNKAKLRVISRKASALCNPAVATAGRSVAPPCLRNLPVTEPPLAKEQREVSVQACEAEIQEASSGSMETPEPVFVIEIPSETVRCSDAAVQTVPFGGCGSPGCMAANVTRTQDAWCATQPFSITEASVDITPAVTRDKKDHLKFVLPPSFGGWCDLFLQRKRPITRKVRTHIISVLFKACYRMTLYPTSRLYKKVLDSLVAKYPHVIEGRYNRCHWSIALRSRFKTARKKLVAAAAVVKARRTLGLETELVPDDDEHAYAHTELALASQEPPLNSSGDLSGCKDPPVQAEELNESKNTSTHKAENSSDSGATPSNSVQFCVVSEPMECVWKSEQLEDVEWVDYPDYSDAVLEDFTVYDPLGMCTDQKASEALMAQQGSLGSPDERDSSDEPVEEVSPQEDEPSSKPEQRGEVSLNRLDPIVVSPSSKSTKQTDDPMDDHDRAIPAPSSKPEQQVEVPLEEPEPVVLVPGTKPAEQAEVSLQEPDPVVLAPSSCISAPSSKPKQQVEAPLEEPERVVLVSDSKPAEQAEVFLQVPDPMVLVPSPKPMEQVEEDLQEAEHVEFELPSFGVFDELLCMKVPVSSTMQQHIVFSLFNALSKKTLHPKKEQIEEAVACLLHKYPHLSSIKTKNGKEFWVNSLTLKLRLHQAELADVPTKRREPRKPCESQKPCEPQGLDHSMDSQRVFRPLRIGEELLEYKDKAHPQGEADAAPESVDGHKRKLAIERHSIIHEMSVEEVVLKFPIFREESALLREFRVLWKRDIVACFERGIKKMFLVLMNWGTSDEIKAISQPGNGTLRQCCYSYSVYCKCCSCGVGLHCQEMRGEPVFRLGHGGPRPDNALPRHA